MDNNIVLDTTMSETTSNGFTTSPLPKTPNESRPLSQQPPQSLLDTDSDLDSDSDYSQYDSPANSRPSSAVNAFEEVPLEDTFEDTRSTASDDTPSETSNGSRPATSHLREDISATGGKKGTLQKDPHISADCSQASGLERLAESMSPVAKASQSSEISGAEQQKSTKTLVQQWNSLARSGISPQQVEPETDTSISRPVSRIEPEESYSEPPTPRITVSPLIQSPEGSDYSGSPPQSPKSPITPTVPVSPMTPQEAHMSIDSLQSIALSESSLDYDHLSAEQVDDVLATPRVSRARHVRKPSSLEILQNTWAAPSRQSTLFDNTKDEPLGSPVAGPEDSYGHGRRSSMMDTTAAWRSESSSSIMTRKRTSGSSEDDELDWSALDKTEEQEKVDKDLPQGAEDESTAFLLARLEQENAKFTADPKSAAGSNIRPSVTRLRSGSRPPSIGHLKKLVARQEPPSIRYSLAEDVQEQPSIDELPPMTELEFWAALVQDYPTTAARLPTLTTTKIRAGVPPPLRGVVWCSMSGARDRVLEDAFEQLKNEQSPYEGIINKDLGRSFPGVELFRDAEGEGQKMLGRVLKSFSLHDKDIGYCQGLGFLVGPLLMNMGEKEAFCVLVRLMDHFALRPSFLPSLSGLHMRIFQFSTLLKQHLPELSDHLSDLGVEPAYLSQWFLSCFAVTCPLQMLFRIYDVIFAEGANETVMRVALALFRRNEQKMLASHEFEDIMQLLLGRALWDVYACNADELVDDFTSLGNIITNQRLAELEAEFEAKDGDAVGQSAGFLPDVQAAASRFLGRLWAPNHGHTPSKSATLSLSPQTAEKDSSIGAILGRPSSFLRRTPSKSNIPIINDSSGSEGSTSSGTASIASTAPTDSEIHDATAREADSMSMKSKAESLRTVSVSTSHLQLQTSGLKEQQELHAQIEDLLMALSDMQREHAQLAAMLQKEREERNDDHRVVKQLIGKLRKAGHGDETKNVRRSMPPPSRSSTVPSEMTATADKRKTLPARPHPRVKEMPSSSKTRKETSIELEGIEGLLQDVQSRLDSNARFSASFETRAQLRTTLARTREQLATAETQVKDLSERAEVAELNCVDFEAENESLRSEAEELRMRVNEEFKEKQRLELTIQNMEIQMRMEAKALEKKQRTDRMARAESSGDVPTLNTANLGSRSRGGSLSSVPGSPGGLRELKLTRRDSGGSVQSIRSMRSQRQSSDQWPSSPPAVQVSPSPPTTTDVEDKPLPAIPPPAPTSTPAPVPSHSRTPSASLAVPGGFAKRTSSLAAQAVLATEKHEPVPDEALLLELVNAKTSEAQARQEVDELRKSLQVQKRRAEEALLEIQAEATSAKLEAEAAKAEAEQARQEAQAARAEIFDASPYPTPLTPRQISFPVLPIPEEEQQPMAEGRSSSKTPEPKKAETPPATTGGGWFWSRRTASTSKAALE